MIFAQESRPRRVERASTETATVSTHDTLASAEKPKEQAAQASQASLLEAMVPRAGLQFYLEIRASGLAELSRSPEAFNALSKAFAPNGKQTSANELTGFVMRNLNALAGARLALAGYGANSAAAIIEVADPENAQRLKIDLRRIANADSEAQTIVAARGRVLIAGSRSVVERLMQADGSLTLNEDREYLKARAHFAGDPFFAYLDTGSMPIPLPATSRDAQSQAYMAGLLAGLSQMPYAVAMGGTMHGEEATLRALIVSGKKQDGGLLTSIFSSVREGQPSAASLAAPDTDLFVNVMIDWDKLYEGLQSLFDMFASAVSTMAREEVSSQSRRGSVSGLELMAGLDSMLGFSIRHDLLPTLGDELAIAISGFDLMAKPTTARSAPASRKPARQSRMLFMIAVRNPVKFESYLTKLLSGPKKAPVRLAQMPYRGAMIKYRSNFAYTIAGGFFIAGPSVADIRRAMDARATGASLAATADFRSAIGVARPAMLQAYLSSKMSASLGQSLFAKGEKTSALPTAPVGVVMTANPEGTMMQIRMPSRMALAALTSVMTSESPVPGINYSPGASTSSGQKRKSPTLTTEDLRYRRRQ